MKNIKLIILFALIIVLFSSCIHVLPINNCVEGTKVYGFWNGLWHGLIAGFSFIGKLFNHDIAIYAVNNNGCWYDFGFLLGAGSALGSSGRTVYVKSRR